MLAEQKFTFLATKLTNAGERLLQSTCTFQWNFKPLFHLNTNRAKSSDQISMRFGPCFMQILGENFRQSIIQEHLQIH